MNFLYNIGKNTHTTSKRTEKGSDDMSHKVYRICLLLVVILAIMGGIFYYLNYVRDKSDITEGTLVDKVKKTETGNYPSREMKRSGNSLHGGSDQEVDQAFWGAYL